MYACTMMHICVCFCVCVYVCVHACMRVVEMEVKVILPCMLRVCYKQHA